MFLSRTAQVLIPGFSDRRAERDRRAAVRQHQALLAALERHQPIVELSTDGVVIGAVPHFAALVGLSPEQLMGRGYLSLLAAGERDGTAARAFTAAVARGEAMTTRLHHARADGSSAVLQLQLTPVPAEDDMPARVVIIASDVTDETRVSADLQGQINAIGTLRLTAIPA